LTISAVQFLKQERAMKLKTWAFLGALLAFGAVPASASMTTYYWHQTSASIPGLMFTGQYTVVDGVTVSTDGNQTPPDLAGLLDFTASGGGVLPVTLADLTPTDPISGFPMWSIDLSGAFPFLAFIDANDAYDYTIGSHTISADSDFPSMCDTTGVCSADGFWSSSPFVTAPEPASLPVLLMGVLGLFGLIRAGRGRIRS
jgi:hypothetical protein